MAGYSRHDVVRVPFPFTDQSAQKNRPALILSDDAAFNSVAAHSVMAMITSAQHTRWPLDVEVADLAVAGLPVASVVRFKLFTLDHRLIRGVLGHLSRGDAARVSKSVRSLFT